VHAGFLYSDILRVEVNRLAVREGPTVSSRLLQGERVVGVSAAEPIGEVRLDAGDFVSVQLGPLVVGDMAWYLVWPAEDARLMYSTISWKIGPGSGPGWVAASVGQEQYLTLHRRPDVSEIEQYLPVGLTVSGIGDYVSEPQPRHDLFAFDWSAVAANAAPCDFSVVLLPEAEATPLAIAETSTSGVAQGPLTGATVKTTWNPFAESSWETFAVQVTGNCTWAIRLAPLHHD
jgi:hypothetical protein